MCKARVLYLSLNLEDNVNLLDMNIPLFEILVLMFVLWPLIQRFLEKNKAKNNPAGNTELDQTDFSVDGAGRPPRRGEPEWQEAMRELEMIFTGDRSPKQDAGSDRWSGEQADGSEGMEKSWNPGSGRREVNRDDYFGQSERRTIPEANERREQILALKKVESQQSNNRLDQNSVNTRRQMLESMQSRPLKKRAPTMRESRAAKELVDHLLESENPIYTSLNVAPEIVEDADMRSFSVFEDIKDPNRLREFFVMKEILDKPMSARRVRNFL
jgi:hypothetical protein